MPLNFFYDQIKKDMIGVASSTHRQDDETTVLDNLKGRDYLRHSDTEGRTIAEWILQKYVD